MTFIREHPSTSGLGGADLRRPSLWYSVIQSWEIDSCRIQCLQFLSLEQTLLTLISPLPYLLTFTKGLPRWCCGKEPACQCRRHKRHGFDPWVRKICGGGHDSPLQYTCLENPMDRVAWWATVHRVSKSQIRLKQSSTHIQHLAQWSTWRRPSKVVES